MLVLGDQFVAAESTTVDALTIPATIGEFWMVAYLLILGVRQTQPARTGSLAAAKSTMER